MSSAATSAWPSWAARCSGATPPEVSALLWAPKRSSAVAVSSCCFLAAMCSGVYPFWRSGRSQCSPDSSHSSTLTCRQTHLGSGVRRCTLIQQQQRHPLVVVVNCNMQGNQAILRRRKGGGRGGAGAGGRGRVGGGRGGGEVGGERGGGESFQRGLRVR